MMNQEHEFGQETMKIKWKMSLQGAFRVGKNAQFVIFVKKTAKSLICHPQNRLATEI
jgi:hypothetical protein